MLMLGMNFDFRITKESSHFEVTDINLATELENALCCHNVPPGSCADWIFYLVRLEALSLHAVFPEGQDAVLKAHCERRKVNVEFVNDTCWQFLS